MAFSDIILKLAEASNVLSPSEKQELYLEARNIEQAASQTTTMVIPGTSTVSVDGLIAKNANIFNSEIVTATITDATITNATVTNATITDAAISNGEVVIDANGINIQTGAAAGDTPNAITWEYSGTEAARIIDYVATANYLRMYAQALTGKNTYTEIVADSPAGKTAQINLSVVEGGVSAGNATLKNSYFEVLGVPIHALNTIVVSENGTPSQSLTANTDAQIYVKGNKLIVKYNDAGTTKYYYFDLTAVADQQVIYSATEP